MIYDLPGGTSISDSAFYQITSVFFYWTQRIIKQFSTVFCESVYYTCYFQFLANFPETILLTYYLSPMLPYHYAEMAYLCDVIENFIFKVSEKGQALFFRFMDRTCMHSEAHNGRDYIRHYALLIRS